MAKNQTVWGIDIGNTSLKALRCSLSGEPGKIEAVACDFIEHSKVLSQPGTDATAVVAETLQTFLGRNTTKGDRIAISVSGQNTISRFLPLPPVDPKKIPDVIRYEAKQWLPFDINDVVFDFQPLNKLAHGDSDDTTMDVTVGMFAIKRDVAAKVLVPYLSRAVDVDSIQSSPIALYNFMLFDQLPPPVEAADDDTPRESLITLCIGTDATDVVITNGETVWIRNIPLGGNSFTKALTRELQLTFSKAEYLKRNVTSSKDVEEQKRVIMAMRPVFNDMVNEVNRSLEYYQTLNRKAKFQKIVAMGNASKLPGLRQFIAQNLGYEVTRLSRFNHLIGAEVVETQLFKDNLPSFAVCYGLAIQQLGISALRTNLIPRDVLLDRIIREKKPWVLAAAASLLLGITIQYAGVTSAHNSVVNKDYTRAEESAKRVQSYSSDMTSKKDQAVSAFNSVDDIGKKLTSNVEGRITWLELLRAVNAALPQSQPGAEVLPPGQRLPFTSASFAQMDRVFIESIEAIPVSSLADWFAPLKENKRYYPDDEELEALMSAASDSGGGTSGGVSAAVPTQIASDDTENSEEGTAVQSPHLLTEEERFNLVTGPDDGETSSSLGGSFGGSSSSSGSGYTDSSSYGSITLSPPTAKVVQIVGYHYHNPSDADAFAEDGGEAYLRKTLLKNLKFGEVELLLPLEEQVTGMPPKTEKVKMSELGISYPVLLYVPNVDPQQMVNPDLLDPRTGTLPPNIVVDPMYLGTSGQSTAGARTPGSPPRSETVPMLSQYARSRGVQEPILKVQRFDFVIQFAWKETPPGQRKLKEESTETSGVGGTQ